MVSSESVVQPERRFCLLFLFCLRRACLRLWALLLAALLRARLLWIALLWAAEGPVGEAVSLAAGELALGAGVALGEAGVDESGAVVDDEEPVVGAGVAVVGAGVAVGVVVVGAGVGVAAAASSTHSWLVVSVVQSMQPVTVGSAVQVTAELVRRQVARSRTPRNKILVGFILGLMNLPRWANLL